jgi:hypothetical protein
MRALTSTLTTAVNASTRRPAIMLSAEDHINHSNQTFSTANSAGFNDSCIAADGSLIRVRLTRGGSSFDQSFQWQRISDPTQGSQWTTWTSFGGGAGNMFQDGGCAVSDSAGTLRAFAQRGTGGNNLWTWSSTDNGLTWNVSPQAVLSPPGGALCAGIGSAGNNDVFFLYQVSGGYGMGVSFFSGTWSALSTWTLATMQGAAGVDVVLSSSLYYVVYSNGYTLYEATCNSSGGSWAQLAQIAPATTSAIGRLSPKLTFFDNLYHLICIENDAGLLTGTTYSYPRVRQSGDLLHWSTGYILHDMPEPYGASLLKTTPPAQSRARYVAVTMAKVALGQDFQQSDSTQYIDLSARVLSCRRVERLGQPGELIVTLDNNASTITANVATYGTTYAAIGLNTLLVLDEGYRTGTPPTTVETVNSGRYHIKQITFERAPDRSRVTLLAYDQSRNLDLVNRYQVTYSNQQLAWLITEVCARAGLFVVNLPATSQMSNVVAIFVLQAGQTYRRALDELCRVYWLEYFMDQSETLQVRELSASDAPIWSYYPEVETLAFGSNDVGANHIVVSGKPPVGGQLGAVTNGEAYDDTNMHVTGQERVILLADPKLTTSTQCSSKAGFLLAQEQRAQTHHTVQVPANPALQLLDVLSLTDQSVPRGTGLSYNARLLGNTMHYDAQSGEYSMQLELEGV